MMDALVSVMEHCIKQGYAVALNPMSVDNPEPTVDFKRLFQTACHLQFDIKEDFDAYLQTFLQAHRGYGNLILFLQDITAYTVSALQAHCTPRQNVIVFHFNPVEEALLEQLQKAGVYCIDFRSTVKERDVR